MSYRRLGIPSLEARVGVGVFYGAAASEAQAVQGTDVYVVGGANSAGQAALHLARYASRSRCGPRASLRTTMSDYPIRQIDAADNIDVRHRTEVVDATGDGRLTGLTLREPDTATTSTVPAAALFVLIGAAPHTNWLPPEIQRDRHGYVLTGTDVQPSGIRRRRCCSRPAAPGSSGRRRPARIDQAVGLQLGEDR